MSKKNFSWSFIFYFTVLVFYSIFSYALVHPSLVLANWPLYWQFQTWIWANIFNQKFLLAFIYVILIISLWLGFYFTYRWLVKANLNLKSFFLILVLFCCPLVISYNALSADLFNYIFNAKLIINYQVNPHVVQPWTVDDQWLRFIQNANGLVPYGYGWTFLSFIPYGIYWPNLFSLEQVKFVPTLLNFKIFMALGFLFTFWVVVRLYKKIYQKEINTAQLALFFFNPLVLIELVGNSHNDVWMILPVFGAFLILFSQKKLTISLSAFSLILFLISTQIKFATILLLPIWFYLVIAKLPQYSFIVTLINKINYFKLSWLDCSVILMFLPLLTNRSVQFYPWYLIWSLIFIPFLKNNFLSSLLLGFSLSSLFRYTPWLFTNEYSDWIIGMQKFISLGMGTALGLIIFIFSLFLKSDIIKKFSKFK